MTNSKSTRLNQMDISEYFENYEPGNTDRILESGFILDYVPSHSLPNIANIPSQVQTLEPYLV